MRFAVLLGLVTLALQQAKAGSAVASDGNGSLLPTGTGPLLAVWESSSGQILLGYTIGETDFE